MDTPPMNQYGEPDGPDPVPAGPARYATAGDLFGAAAAVDGEDFTLKSGMMIRVRPISREANLELGKGDPGVPTMEARLLAAGVIEPRMSVQGWLDFIKKASTTQVSEISDKVRHLSGMGEGADKSSV